MLSKKFLRNYSMDLLERLGVPLLVPCLTSSIKPFGLGVFL